MDVVLVGRRSDALERAKSAPSARTTATERRITTIPCDVTDPEESGMEKSNPVVDVLNEIRMSWDFMAKDDFNPVPQALSLLDTSSLGHDYGAFMHTYNNLEKAMDLIVNDYYQSFNYAIHTFSNVVESISGSRNQVSTLRSNLESSQSSLQNKRFDLLHLWLKSIQYKEIQSMLDTIEELQKTPETLENLLQGKFFLKGVRTLVAARKSLQAPEYEAIGALETIRQKLDEVHSSLHETLNEELHDHLYLKSPISFNRLDPKYQPQRKGTGSMFSDARKVDPDAELAENLETNPELNSFHYMRCLVESLSLLGKLPEALEMLHDRLPVEIYCVVERVIQELDQSETALCFRGTSNITGVPDLLELSRQRHQLDLFRRLLSTLYIRMTSIFEAHCFLIGVIDWYRKDFDQSHKYDDVYTKQQVWSTIQNELKSLLYDYLMNPETAKDLSTGTVTLSDILKDKQSNRNKNRGRTPGKHLLRVSLSDDTSSLLAMYNKTVGHMSLETSKPGVSLTKNPFERLTEENPHVLNVGFIDKYAENMMAAGHRLLVTPDATNILVAFKPTVEFVVKMEELMSMRFEAFKNFLDDFVLNVFLQQVEDRALNYYHTFVDGVDAFHCDTAVDGGAQPIVKGAVSIRSLVRGMCRALYVFPVHQNECVQIIENVIQSFYDKCASRFRSLMSSEQSPDGMLSAQWAKDEDLAKILTQNYQYQKSKRKVSEPNITMLTRELLAEMKLKRERSLHRSEIILDYHILEALCNLHRSLEWLVKQIEELRDPRKAHRRRTQAGSAQTRNERSNEHLYIPLSIDIYCSKWQQDETLELGGIYEIDEYLPLATEMNIRFDDMLTKYRKLSQTCLFALRIELHCHALYYLDLAMREGTYMVEGTPQEPDPYIISLTQDVMLSEEVLSSTLPQAAVRFVLYGFPEIISQVLCSNLKHIKAINEFGVIKLIRNVQSLQQCMTCLTVNVGHQFIEQALDHARVYFEMLTEGVEGFLSSVKRFGKVYSYDEYKIILDILFREPGGTETVTAHPEYVECFKKLKDIFLKL